MLPLKERNRGHSCNRRTPKEIQHHSQHCLSEAFLAFTYFAKGKYHSALSVWTGIAHLKRSTDCLARSCLVALDFSVSDRKERKGKRSKQTAVKAAAVRLQKRKYPNARPIEEVQSKQERQKDVLQEEAIRII
mmetsp:Transcript_13608/g.27007  ORF Transcript_13608/g.27007 Transcript_13608/m.27007 type:complete len:133 (+) Transcript_13608:1108-1506(+)